MNTHETYVSIETAQLLKQAGFDWETEFGQHIWDRGKRLETNRNFNSEKYLVSLPTLDVAQKWLREVKGLPVEVNSDINKYYSYSIIGDKNGYWKTICFGGMDNIYEEAQEAGIKKCLTLILEKDGKV